MTDRGALRNELVTLICDQLTPLEPEDLSDDVSLIDDAIVDSLGLTELFVWAEGKLGRQLEETERTRSNFGTIGSIVNFVSANVSG